MDGGVHPPQNSPLFLYILLHCLQQCFHCARLACRGLFVPRLPGYTTTTYLPVLPVGVSSNLPACFVSLPVLVPWYQVRCLPVGTYVPLVHKYDASAYMLPGSLVLLPALGCLEGTVISAQSAQAAHFLIIDSHA